MIYSYTTSADGLCEYASKAAAIRNATKVRALEVRTLSGRVVWRNPLGGEKRGEICDASGTPVAPQPQLD